MPFRRITVTLHLWVGLALAAYAAVVGVTGSILVFRGQISSPASLEFQPELSRHSALARLSSPEAALTLVRNRYPGWRPFTLTWPNETSPFWMTYLLSGRRALEVYQDPGTAAITGTRDPSKGWMSFVERLHANLLAGRSGRLLSGVGALGLLLLSATGVYLWWPGRRWGLRSRELHFGTGLVSAAFIAMFSVTGLYFVLPQAFELGARLILGRHGAPRLPPAAVATNSQVLSLDELSRRAQQVMPGLPIHRIEIVDRPNESVRVTFREGRPEQFHLVSTVFLHPVTGDVLQTARLSGRSAGDTLLAWLSALHFGIFGGLFVKVVWALAGLSLPVLATTGFLMWMKKRRAVPRRASARESLFSR